MVIRILGTEKSFEGTPLEIVGQMRYSHHKEFETLKEYIDDMATRAFLMYGKTIEIEGRTHEEICLNFLHTMANAGLAFIERTNAEDATGRIM